MNFSAKNILSFIASILLLVGIFFALKTQFSSQDIEEIKERLLYINYNWIALSVLLGFFAYISRAIRWKYLIEPLGYTTSTLNLSAGVAITYLANAFLPRSGEVLRPIVISKKEDIPLPLLIGTVVVERIIDMICLLLLIGWGFLLHANKLLGVFSDGASQTFKKKLTLLAALIALLFFIFLLFKFFQTHLKKTILYQKISQALKELIKGIESIQHLKNRKKFIFHTLFIWTCYFLMTYIMVFAFPETNSISLSDGLFLLILGAIGMVIPTPGGAGSYHGAITAGFIALGYSGVTGMTFAFVMHAAHYLLGVTSGLVGLLILKLNK